MEKQMTNFRTQIDIVWGTATNHTFVKATWRDVAELCKGCQDYAFASHGAVHEHEGQQRLACLA